MARAGLTHIVVYLLSSVSCFIHSSKTLVINNSNLESSMLGETSEITQLSDCNRQTFTQSDIGEVSNCVKATIQQTYKQT